MYCFYLSDIQVSSDCKSVTLQTTDDQVVTVTFHEPVDSALDGWVEVHGYAKDKGIVIGKSCYNLPASITNDFGMLYKCFIKKICRCFIVKLFLIVVSVIE